MSKCELCSKDKGTHKAVTLNCPQGDPKYTRVWPTSYSNDNFFISDNKLSKDESEAAGYYFGISNLGLDLQHRNYKKYSEYVTKNAPNWKRVRSELINHLHSYMESDEMLDNAMAEINSWIKIFKSGKDKSYLDSWKNIIVGKEE